MAKYFDDSALSYFWGKIKTIFAKISDLAAVATSGNYTDLSNTPTIPDELADLSDDSTHRVVTDTEKATWNGKYAKPSGGIPASDLAGDIPASDLAAAVQTSLGKADTAVQPFAVGEVARRLYMAQTTWADVYAALLSIEAGDNVLFEASAITASLLTNGKVSVKLKGFVTSPRADAFDFFATYQSGGFLYSWRISDATVNGATFEYLNKYTGTPI